MSTQPIVTSQSDRTSGDRQLRQGLLKRVPNLALAVLGQPQTTTSIVALIDQRVSAIDAAVQAHGTLSSAVQAAATVLAGSDPVIAAVKQYIRVLYENDPGALADFGLRPRRTRKLTAAQQAAANAKRQATRKSRGEVARAAQAPSATGPAPEPPAAAAPAPAPAPVPVKTGA